MNMKDKKFKQTEIGEIPEDWQVVALADVADFKNGFAFSSKDYVIKSETTMPVFKMGNIAKGGGIRIGGDEDHISKELVDKLNEFITQKDNILMCMTDMKASMNLLGYSARIKNEIFLQNQRVGRIVARGINPVFLYYYLNSSDFIRRIRTTARSGVQVNLTTEAIKSSSVILPGKDEQLAIAKILSDLDEKIELNQQINKTIESVAQALFKRWFVDFEFPGHEKTKLIGGLPEGWREGKIIEVCDIVMGQSPPGETYNESGEGAVFYQGNRDFGFRFPTPRVYCTTPTRIAEAGDILISVRAPVGALNITLEQCAIGRGIAALRMKQYSNGFLFYFLSTKQDLWNQFNSEGTVFGCLNKTEFHKIVLPIPSNVVMRQFDMVVKPIEKMIRKNELETRALGNIRDSILPRLMSGKIRVN